MKRWKKGFLAIAALLFVLLIVQPASASNFQDWATRIKIYCQYGRKTGVNKSTSNPDDYLYAAKQYYVKNGRKLNGAWVDESRWYCADCLAQAGCNLFAYAHAIEWISGTNMGDNLLVDLLSYCENPSDWKPTENDPPKHDFPKCKAHKHSSADSAYKQYAKTLGIDVDTNGASYTSAQLRTYFDKGYVFVTHLSWSRGGHYACAVDYAIVNDKTGEILDLDPSSGVPSGCSIYIEIIDSCASASTKSGRPYAGITYTEKGGKLTKYEGRFGTQYRWPYWIKLGNKKLSISAKLRGNNLAWTGHVYTKYDPGRWYAGATKETPIYQSNNTNSTVIRKIPSGDGVIITGMSPNASKPEWYKTNDGWIKASDLSSRPVEVASKLNGTETKRDISIVVNPAVSRIGLSAEPYDCDGKPTRQVTGKTDLNIIAVWKNKHGNYWLETDDHQFIVAKDAKLNTAKSPKVTFRMGSGYKGPNADGSSDYNPVDNSSIGLHGIITGDAPITKVEAGWYWYVLNALPMQAVPACTIKDVNAKTFDLTKDYKDASGKNQTCVNNSLNASTLYNNIRSYHQAFSTNGKVTLHYRVKVYYRTYTNVTGLTEDPIQEASYTVIDYKFTANDTKGTPVPDTVPVTDVTLDKNSATIKIDGETYGTSSLRATVTPDNATNKRVTWSSSNNNVAKVEDGKVTAIGPGTATITATADDGSGKKATCTVTVLKMVSSITISPSSATLYANGSNAQKTLKLAVSVAPADASNSGVTWSSSDTNVVTVDQVGNLTAKAVGKATITAKAKDDSGRQGTCTVEVRNWVDTVALSGESAVTVDAVIRLSPSVTPADASNKKITWTSSDNSIATVDGSGNVKGIKAGGPVTITATAADRGTITATKQITVIQPVTRINLSGNGSVLQGKTTVITAEVLPADAGNKSIVWSSENTAIATVSDGVVTARSAGTTTIWATAADGSGVKAPFNVRVLKSVTGITISGETLVPVDGSISLTAAVTPSDAGNRAVTWSADPSTRATVDQNGVVKGLQPGSVQITATAADGSGTAASHTIQVVKQQLAIRIEGASLVHAGQTGQLTAVVTSDEPLSDTGVTWSTSDPGVVTVDANGLLTGVANGTATITATSSAESYYSAQHQVTVDTLVNKITVAGTNKVDAGSAVQLTATVSPAAASNRQLTWSSSNESIALVDSTGKVKALSAGTAVITAAATDGSGVKGTLTITVYPLPGQINITGQAELLMGSTAQFTAEVLPANARNKAVTWSSSDASVAAVSAGGLVTPKGNGTAVITAAADGNPAVTASYEVTVTTRVASVALSAPEQVDVGGMGAVTAEVLPATASNRQLVWTSSDEDVAVVDANGNVFGKSGGYVTITAAAADGSGITAEAEIRIFQYVRDVSVDVEPVAYVGQTLYPFAATLPEDASEPYMNWTSSNEDIIRIEEFESESDYELTAVCVSPGVARITATATDGSGVSGYAYVQVLPYVELNRTEATYTIYPDGDTKGTIGRVSMTADCASRTAEEKHGAVWSIEHVSGDYAAALGINERKYSYSGFTLTNGVDLMLLGINRTGSDTYRVKCTVNGLSETCLVTVNVEEPAAPLPESVALSTTTFNALVGEEIPVSVTPVVTPAAAALPGDANPFLYGVDAFNRYAQVSMGEDVFTVTFSKAGVYTAYVRYQGANYQYDAYATFVITTPEGTVPPEVETLSISDSMMYLLPGETARFDVEIAPAGADESTLVWSSSNTAVVTVAGDGTMTAVGAGTAIITVSGGSGVSATGFVAVTESLLSIDWNPSDIIEVYVGGESRTPIQKVYLTQRASAQLESAPVWTLKRKDGNNLTLTCEPVTAVNAAGDTLYGCAIILKSVSNIGITEYELTCSDGEYSTATTILVNANSVEDRLPSLVKWSNTTFAGTVNQRMTIHPVVQCWPEGTALPSEVTLSIEGDSYWNAAIKLGDYTISRSAITVAFAEPGVYTANCIYSCANMRYLVPITVRVADENGDVPVRLMQLTLSESDVSIKAGDTLALSAAFGPADATNKEVSWSSDNPAVATVSAEGLVTGVANGRANIICTPADTNCTSVRCTVVVEDSFTVLQYQEMDFQYLQGETGNPVAGFKLSDGTAKRMAAEGLTPAWTLTRVSGNAAEVELREYNGTRFIVVTGLNAGGTDTYEVACTAGDYSWSGQTTLEVNDLGVSAPERVTLAATSATASVGEEITLDFTPVCEPAGASIPAALEADYVGIGDFYSALADDYRYTLFTAGDTVTLGFKKPGVYLLSRQYRSCNLTYVTECTITVGDGSLDLIKCLEDDPVVYLGGKSGIATTCITRDTSIDELYGDQLTWSAERLSGDCLTVALRADQSSASLYVVHAKEEGEEVWRISCSFKGITDSVDVTIHSVQARSELPETAALYQSDFDGMIGNAVVVPLAVECSPEGTDLPTTDDGAWTFSADANTRSHAAWSFADGQMKIVFSESGYYGGDLVYNSGNVSFRFPVRFAVTDEESVQAEPGDLAVSISSETVTVYPEGKTGVAIVNAVLTDVNDADSLASVAAYAERNQAAWSVQILSGNACSLSVNSLSAAGVELVLDSVTGTGDVTYRIQCSVDGRTASAEGTVHVAGDSEERPQPELKQDYFTTPTGTMLTVDASLYDHTHTIKLCSGKDSIWDNVSALAAMGFEYETLDDLLMPVFYEPGAYTTTVTNRIGNLTFTQELVIVVYTARKLPASPAKLTFPTALREIDNEAFEGVSVNIIDLRGTSVTAIGQRAFAQNSSLMRVYIPASVTSIHDSAFAECSGFVICCAEGSYADTWAQSMKYPVVYHME